MNELYERVAKQFSLIDDIRVLPIGEDNITFVALGHYEPHIALDVFDAEARGLGWIDAFDGNLDEALALKKVEQSWAILRDHCPETADDDHDKDDCSECALFEEWGWMLFWDEEAEHPDTFPVTVLQTYS